MTSTISDHRSKAFGHTKATDQANFEKNKENAINHLATKTLKKSLDGTKSCFDETIRITSNTRRKIAISIERRNAKLNGTTYNEESCYFGQPRLKNPPTIYEVVLGGALYEHTGNKVATKIAEDLSSIPQFNSFTEDQRLVGVPSETPCDDKGFNLHMDWQFFHPESALNTKERPNKIPPQEIMSQPELSAIARNPTAVDLETFTALYAQAAHELAQTKRSSDPESYEKDLNLSLIAQFRQQLPRFNALRPSPVASPLNPKGYIMGTLSYTIQGQPPIALTKYTTYIDATEDESNEEILNRLKTHSFVKLTHQDTIDVPTTLSHAKLYFDDAINWDKDQGLVSLIESVGKMIFLLAHNHRDVRGTAAETEWIEAAIYKFHGLEFQPQENRMPDLIAFGAYTMQQYLEDYKQSFTLTEKTNP